jgi:hypothetical protein
MKKNSLKFIKAIFMLLFFIIISITLIFSITDKNKTSINQENQKNIFKKNKNVLKIENAKLIGSDKNNRPYVITAASSYKNNLNENIIYLKSVEADMTLNDNNWMLLHTNNLIFNTLEKTLTSEEKVLMFYDDGTKLESSRLKYNVLEGTGYGGNGVKMFGEWGIIQSNAFSFDVNSHKFKFFDNPKLILN